MCGGVIPEQDYDYLKQKGTVCVNNELVGVFFIDWHSGVTLVFGPGTRVYEAALEVVEAIERNQQQKS